MGGEARTAAEWRLLPPRDTAEGSPDDPLLPRLQPDPALPRVPGTCPTRRCFQHLRLGAQPLLHSRKIFVQGLGTRRGGNKSHLGVERAALLRLLCLPLQVASQALRPTVPGPGPGIPLHRRACFRDGPGVPATAFLIPFRQSSVSPVSRRLRNLLCAWHSAGPWTLSVNQALPLPPGSCELVRQADRWGGRDSLGGAME